VRRALVARHGEERAELRRRVDELAVLGEGWMGLPLRSRVDGRERVGLLAIRLSTRLEGSALCRA